jgi:hypothetical protein
VETVLESAEGLELVRFVLFSSDALEVFDRELSRA